MSNRTFHLWPFPLFFSSGETEGSFHTTGLQTGFSRRYLLQTGKETPLEALSRILFLREWEKEALHVNHPIIWVFPNGQSKLHHRSAPHTPSLLFHFSFSFSLSPSLIVAVVLLVSVSVADITVAVGNYCSCCFGLFWFVFATAAMFLVPFYCCCCFLLLLLLLSPCFGRAVVLVATVSVVVIVLFLLLFTFFVLLLPSFSLLLL